MKIMQDQVSRLREIKRERSQIAVDRSIKELRQSARSEKENLFAAEIEAVRAGLTQGEIIAVLREELGFGQPLIVA
jgi:methylmalonyl-CoA mutase N-terminal domain/subunit